jgi:hypothetical protein
MGRQIVAGRASRQVKLGPSELVGAGPLAVTLPPDLAARSLPLRPGQSLPLDLPAFINALGPNDRIRFVGIKFVRIIGEQLREENLWSWL